MLTCEHNGFAFFHEVKTVHRLADHDKKSVLILVILEDRLPSIATRCHVIDRTWEFNAQGGGGQFVDVVMKRGKRQGLTLLPLLCR